MLRQSAVGRRALGTLTTMTDPQDIASQVSGDGARTAGRFDTELLDGAAAAERAVLRTVEAELFGDEHA